MNIQVGKWGNSYAVRIPSILAKEMGLKEETELHLQFEAGKLVLRHVEPAGPVYSPDSLLEQITHENTHENTDWVSAVGREEI